MGEAQEKFVLQLRQAADDVARLSSLPKEDSGCVFKWCFDFIYDCDHGQVHRARDDGRCLIRSMAEGARRVGRLPEVDAFIDLLQVIYRHRTAVCCYITCRADNHGTLALAAGD